jgi:protein-disulfide isomerase
VRRALLLVLLAVRAGAEPRLDTSSTHEVVYVPPSPHPIRGPRFAPVTIDLYFAFGHGPSLLGAELAHRLVEHAPRADVREVLHLAASGPISASVPFELAAEALIEAERAGRTWAFFDRLLDNPGLLGTAELARLGREVGLDGDALDEALATHRHRAEIERRLAEAQASGHSAGELFFNGRRASVWMSEEQLQAPLAEARRRAEALSESGVPLSRLYDQLTEADAPAALEPGAPAKRRQPDLTGAPSRGPSLAPVTVVVYSNLACVACAELSLTVRKVADAHPGLVREVWRNFLPPYAGGTVDATAAELAVAAADKGRFWELHDRAIASRSPSVRRTRAELESLARRSGLEVRAPQAKSNELKKVLEREQAEAHTLGVPFAPTVLVNGIMLVGVTSFERVDRVVRAELERSLLDRLGE